MKKKLSDRQKAFADYYIETGNATEAARRAGYKGNNLNRVASENLSKLGIKQYIDERMKQIEDKRIADGKEVLQYLTKVMRGEEKDQFGLEATLQDRTKAAELLAKRYKVLEKDNTKLQEEKEKLEIENKKLQNEKIKIEVEKLKPDTSNIEDNPLDLPIRLVAPCYAEVDFDIEDKEHKEYVLYGGRGSTKSSFISEEIVKLIKNNPGMHALCLRKVSNTLKDSVFNQIKWAIDALGLNNEFKCTVSPLEITYLKTGQKIYFRGADDPMKIKSIKPPFGYIGVAWFEELDQFAGPEEVRNIEQSAIRGGDDAYIFKSFNPPKTKMNWANKYVEIPKENQFKKHTTYLDVPRKWLGKAFIDEAEYLKQINPNAYEHEYGGVANGNGGNIFDNVEIRKIKEDELKIFDRIYNGVDWGWYPDPWTFNRMHYNSASRTLYIFDEAHENKKSNRQTYKILINDKGIKPNDKITCDSAEHKSTQDYRDYGLYARDAIKGPGSVDYSMKWFQSLNKIIIDNIRCPETAKEFLSYEYDRDKEGNVISGYPDKDNHHIDACRYALEEIWRRKGQ
ncbi:PBSX family phage terminase large subunit [Clostridium botulinum]|uniref:PBSX family phage terminase large subunit n=1 Tax=Clostridium botulinum TaxID=1491 RepID=UPI0013FE626D|nr:PBSX family phage terminase large subunit [Clostridium botulinum]MBY6916043.1 PBSX family phage terminase large subunit [Clostridium botulinum]NFQ39502.1 PBSX family phage terminase large subunit [Clostridium botulinum]